MNRLLRIVQEIHRRSLWQVVAVYLGASWLVMQVVSLVAVHLALPDWVTPVAILLLLIGLPIVVATAFVQEGLPARGRAEPAAAGDDVQSDAPARGPELDAAAIASGAAATASAADNPRATASPEPAHHRLLTWRNALAGGVIAFALLGVVSAGYMGARALGAGRAVGVLDPNAVAVLPFRVTGDTSLVWLREGVVDLLSAKLAGGTGPRAIDSRATLVQWRRVAEQAGEVTQEDARAIATRLGAGRFILGDAVGAGSRITLAARLVDTNSGRVIHTARREGDPDDALGLLDRVVAELLVREAGEDMGRIDALTSTSLPAVQAYLAGQAAYRASRYEEAALRFGEAVAQDSTFALAALYLAHARGWSGYGPDYERGIRLAYEGRDRLGERDRRHVLALAARSYPEPLSPPQQIQAYQRLLDVAADNAEAWYGYADAVYHDGYAAGIPDASDRARAGFERAVAIDSSFGPALHHLIELVAFAGDTVTLRRLAGRVEAALTSEGGNLGWIIAEGLRDTAALRRVYGLADTLRLGTIYSQVHQAALHGFGLASAPVFLDIAERRSVTQQQQNALRFNRRNHELRMGRPTAALAANSAFGSVDPEFDGDLFAVLFALTRELPPEIGREAAARMTERLGAGTSRSDRSCLLSVWYAAEGDIPTAEAHAKRLAVRPPDLSAEVERRLVFCGLWVDAAIALAREAPNVRARLAAIDDWLLEHHVVAGPWAAITLWLAWAWEAVGDDARAYAAARRLAGTVSHIAPRLLTEARLAERLGKTDAAIRAYRHFLLLYSDPEPGWASEQADEARRALARMTQA